ncbi:MAG: lysozyme [Candidatus Micrarchaeia archaeon]
MTKKCLDLVKAFEGFSARPYLCPAGYWTIGYGHVLGKTWQDTWGSLIFTKEQAEEMLLKTLKNIEFVINSLIEVDIHDYMLDALISFSYNCGIYAFRASTLRRLINQGELYQASEQFTRWVYAGGKKLNGLVRRRQAEKELYLKGLSLLN